MRLSVLLCAFLLAVSACKGGAGTDGRLEGGQQQYVEQFCGVSTNAACASDDGCKAGGCSGQVCGSARAEPMLTTCEFRDCYDALRYGLRCGCVANTCRWARP